MLIAPVGFYTPPIQITLSGVSTLIMASGDLITAGKVIIPNCVRNKGGAALLKEFWLLQQDTSSTPDLEKHDTELFVFSNEDELGALVSNDPFVFDATTTIAKLVYHKKFLSTDWITTPDGVNCYLRATDINAYCQVADSAGYSLGFCLVTGSTPTFSNHVLTTRFSFEQLKTAD